MKEKQKFKGELVLSNITSKEKEDKIKKCYRLIADYFTK